MENNGKLKVELVALNRSFDTNKLSPTFGFTDNWVDVYNKVVLERIQNSDADLLVFAGGALKAGDFTKLKKQFSTLENVKPVVLVEEWGGGNIMHLLNYKGKDVRDLAGNDHFQQLFSESSHYNKYVTKKTKDGKVIKKVQSITTYDGTKISGDLITKALRDKMQSNIFTIKGKRFAVIQCGEINFLAGRDVKDPQSGIRKSNVHIRRMYKKNQLTIIDPMSKMLTEDVDVVLNVIHTPMGEPHVLQAKWKWLSEQASACLAVWNCMTTTNVNRLRINQEAMKRRDSFHYAYVKNCTGTATKLSEISSIIPTSADYYSKTYEI